MSDQDATQLAMLIELHLGLDQLGPGSEATTERAFDLLPRDLPLGAGARILDLGCGTGRQTLTLARLAPEATIVGVDLMPPMVEYAEQRIAAAGLADRVSFRAGSMIDDRVASAPAQLVWSEGAIYNVGVRKALDAWRQVLAPGGCVAFSEVSWLGESRPEAARAFWAAGYPEMQSIEGNLAVIESSGYELLGHFTLPESDWWSYYQGQEPSYHALTQKYADDPQALAVLETQRVEQDLYRAHAEAYGYEFYVTRRSGS